MADEQMAVEAVDSAEPVGTEPSAVGATDAGVAEAGPFFSWKDDESGEETVFKKPAELADFLRHSGMRKKTLEAEMAKIGERSKRLEELERKFQSQESLASQMASKYQPIDELMKGNPQFEQLVFRAYDQMVKGKQGRSSDPRDLVREILKEELRPIEEFKSEYEKERERQKAQSARQRAIERIRESDPGFDEGLVEGYLKRFEEYPPEEQQYAALQVAWDAVRGSTSAAELERRAAESRARRRPPSVTSTPGRNAEIDVTKMTDEEMRAAALREIGG